MSKFATNRIQWILFLLMIALAGCGAEKPATIIGTVFRDLNANGVREAREPGQPDIMVSVYNENDIFIVSTITDADGNYILNPELDTAKILAGKSYCVMFEQIPAPLGPGPAGADSGAARQFVAGGATNVSFGLFSPEQYVPDDLPQ